MSKPGARVLVVDDEIEIIRALQRNLVAHGYKVFPARSGEDAIEIFQQHRPDLVLLDLMLPGMSGLEVCRWIRTTSTAPIIVLSVKGTEKDKVQALDAGADDYILKPFGMNEVLARIRAALRHIARVPLGTEPQIHIGPLEMDLAHRDVRLNKKELQLTPTEYDLLKVFLMHRGKILTRQMLLTDVWGENSPGRSHSLHVYVAQLRQKIEPTPDQPRFILTIPGVGYRFNDDEGEDMDASKS
jgi:two-component system KDP operon response regulator KdpE